MNRRLPLPIALLAALAAPLPALAQNLANPSQTVASAPDALRYADLVDLVLPADLVARAQVRKVARLKPEQSPGLAAGKVRLYIEARTSALLAGPDLGESIRFLADVPLDARGRPPKLAKTDVLVIGHTVAGRPGELLLSAPDAMLAWSPTREQALRAILTEKLSPDAPPAVKGVREALHVPGNLAGEGETQVFLATEGARPAALSIISRPGQPRTWGVSFSEIVDQSAKPPAPETLAWYRLACFLPQTLPARANISDGDTSRAAAADDYAFARAALGTCERGRTLQP
ncbi:hypothetical protein [Novosphingobium olei]|uniref:Uncharacterized protein n=1 Tax=Novosphingobium olei TaxID=2728851 RepID=A0A7Y0BQR4_9SPHN|nr:hypothetical protein [Novosphingobium olei]NML94713.1 hypothetical protein [Novosphingobium olei]